MKDLKYLAAYLNPLFAIMGFWLGGIFSFSNVILSFVIVPLLDMIGPNSSTNLNENERASALSKKLFDWLLYFNVFIVYAVIGVFIFQAQKGFTTLEWIGNTLSTGIVIGTCGINVAHELGHRKSRVDQFIAGLLLLPAFYLHFTVEHNRGHHKNVATEDDPASADRGELIYSFWLKSIIGSYFHAWKLEKMILSKSGTSAFHIKNRMIWFQLVQLVYLEGLYVFFGWKIAAAILLAGVVGILLLESINYIEHYGLRRKMMPSGYYEQVQPVHSWNANYYFGRIVLYELTRHSDHHYKASKKYQVLDHHASSPELPFGYPMSIIISLIPPLWFLIMDPLIPEGQTSGRSA
jgi:alkane 1-monooxygenase